MAVLRSLIQVLVLRFPHDFFIYWERRKDTEPHTKRQVGRVFVSTALPRLEKLLDQSLKDARDNSSPPVYQFN